MSCPSIQTRPRVGSSNPASTRSSVVLPQPEPPRSEKISPRAIASDTSSTAVTGPKRLVTPSTRTKGDGPRAAAPAGDVASAGPGGGAGDPSTGVSDRS